MSDKDSDIPKAFFLCNSQSLNKNFYFREPYTLSYFVIQKLWILHKNIEARRKKASSWKIQSAEKSYL